MALIQMLLLISSILAVASASNILAVVPLPARSHVKLFEPMVEELAKRGHHVTYVTPFGFKPPLKNVQEIIISPTKLNMVGGPPNFFDMRHDSVLSNIVGLPKFTVNLFNQTMATEEFQSIFKTGLKYDVIIMEAMLTEAMAAGLSYKLQAPLIGYATIMPSYWTSFWVGNPSPTSYIPDPFTSLPYKMTFWERFLNVLFDVAANGYHQTLFMQQQDEMMRLHFGNDLPPIKEIIANTSLLFVNDHYSLSFPRPAVPNLISIGGIHLQPPNQLPQDLKKYMDESVNGVILFSLGSNLKSADMGPEKIQLFLNAFSKLKQNVLWKFEKDLLNKPSNVLTSDWLPQSDILAHPNLKLFITHGGLLSTIESVDRGVPIIGIPIFGDQPMNMKQSVNAGVGLSLDYDSLSEQKVLEAILEILNNPNTIESVDRGVPIIGIPIFGDQPMNMKQSVNAGVGLSLDYDSLSEQKVLEAILEILNNPKYTVAAKTRSKALQDTPVSPKETAMWWVEYVMRHKGAPHLRSVGQDLTWYQKQQLDVLATLLAVAAVTIYMFKRTTCAICKKLYSKKQKVEQKKKRN